MPETTPTRHTSGHAIPTLESRPIPEWLDPTARTVEQLHREVMWIEKARQQDYTHIKELFREAIGARDEAIKLVQDFTNRTPTTPEVAQNVQALERLTLSMFADVTQQLASIKTESNSALEKALQAQEKSAVAATTSIKDAIDKSEGQFIKQIEQQRSTTQQTAENVDVKINALKDRLTQIEGHHKGAGDQWAIIIAVVMALIAFGSLAFTAFVALKK